MGFLKERRARIKTEEREFFQRALEKQKNKHKENLDGNEEAIVEELESLLAGKQPESPEIQAATDYIGLIKVDEKRVIDFARAYRLTSHFNLGVHQERAQATIKPLSEEIGERSANLGPEYEDTIEFIEQKVLPALGRVYRATHGISSEQGFLRYGAERLQCMVDAAPNTKPTPKQMEMI